MLGKIKAVVVASVLAALATSSAANASGDVLLDSGNSTYGQGFRSGPHETPNLLVQARFGGFGITPSVVHFYFSAHGVVVNDCTPLDVRDGAVSFEAVGFTGDLVVGFCDEGIILPERNKAFTWEVHDIQ